MHQVYSSRNRDVLGQGRKLLIGYVPVGYPDKESFFDVLDNCQSAGVDIFEIGYPASDPASDGPVIKNALSKVDRSLGTDLNYWRIVRDKISAPIWLMGYRKDFILTDGFKGIVESGNIDALVIPDLKDDEYFELADHLANFEVDVVGFIRQSMTEEQRKYHIEKLPLIYHQLHDGRTGEEADTEYKQLLQEIRENPDSYAFAGFGINSPEKFSALLKGGYNGVIIGSELVRRLNRSPNELYLFIQELNKTKG